MHAAQVVKAPGATLEEAPAAPNPARHRLAIIIALVTVAGLLAGIAARYALRSDTPAFQFARLERGRIDATVAATGTCNAVVDVQAGSQVSGNINALYADFNTQVKAGQLVALIDPEMFEARANQASGALRNSQAALDNAIAAAAKADADLASARAAEVNQRAVIVKTKAAVSDASTKLARRKTMFTEEILSKEDLDTAQNTYAEAVADEQAAEAQDDAALHNVQAAQAAVNAAKKTIAMFQAEIDSNQAALKQARIDLEHTRITAPVDGTVIARRMDVGQTVAASFQAPTIFEIAQDLTKMQVDTNVAESDVGRVQTGQAATFTVDAYPALTFQGTVVQIREAPINVQNVITYDVVIQVANPDLKLFPGMTANVTILTRRSENALKLPNAALRVRLPAALLESPAPPRSSAVLYVAATTKGKARAIPIKLGISDGNFTEILQGDLRDGQAVITGVQSSTAQHAASTAPAPATGAASRF